MSWKRLLGAVCTTVFVARCTSSDPSRAPVELRPGVVTVYEFPQVNDYWEIAITDVERFEGTIVVLAIRYQVVDADQFGSTVSGSPYYFVSDDDGATWNQRAVTPATPADQYRLRHVPSGGLLVHGGSLYELVPTSVERGIGTALQMMIYRLDLTNGVRHLTGTVDAEQFYYDGVGFASVGVIGNLDHVWTQWDAVTGAQLDRRTESLAVQRRSCLGRWWDDGSDGTAPNRDLHITCQNESPGDGPTYWCRGRQSPPRQLVADYLCFDQDQWPVPRAQVRRALNGPQGLLVTTAASSDAAPRTSLALMDAAGVRLAPIGPGNLHGRYADDATDYVLQRARFGPFTALVEPGEPTTTTLYRSVAEGEFEAVPLPTRPCAPGRPCGYRPYTPSGSHRDSVLEWTLPLGNSDYLMFYVVDTNNPSSLSSRNIIYASREHLETNTVVTPPQTGPLVQACALATSCFANMTAQACITEFLTAPAARYDAFVAASTCAQIRPLLPAFAREECTDATSSCVGTVVHQTWCGGTIVEDHDCADVGGTCEVVGGFANCANTTPCPSTMTSCLADGRADSCGQIFDCPAIGRDCVVDPSSGYAGCAERQPLCAATGAICIDAATTAYCSGAGHGTPYSYCGRLPGYECSSGACRPTAVHVCEPDRCEGTRMTFCYEMALTADCATFGLTCAVGANGAARCQ